MKNLHVVSLKGVCLDGGPVPHIVLPHMANGSLASYLRKEQKNLIMKDGDVQYMRKSQVGLILFIRSLVPVGDNRIHNKAQEFKIDWQN